jgi:hypothetical protein
MAGHGPETQRLSRRRVFARLEDPELDLKTDSIGLKSLSQT